MLGIHTLTICAALLMQVDGKTDYLARCVGCHGADGTGGGHGPAIVDVPRPRATSKAAVLELIRNGIPDRGMPAFQISDEEASAIADYVMFLKSPPKTPAPVASSGMPPPANGSSIRTIAAVAICCEAVAVCSGRTFRMWAANGRSRKSNRRCAILALAGNPAAAEEDVAGPLTPQSPYTFAMAAPSKALRRTRATSICNCSARTKSCICCPTTKSQRSFTTNR